MTQRRVAFVTTGLGTGGAEAMLYRVATGLDRARFDLSVISVMDAGTYGPRLEAAGVPVRCVGFTSRVPTPSRLARLFEAVRDTAPDLLVGWMYHGNLAASLARRWVAPQAALVWNIRHCVYDLANENRVTRQLIRLGARVARGADSVVYVSPVSREQHLALGYPRSGAEVIGNGLDSARFRVDRSARAQVRAEFGVDPDDVVIGHVGRLDPMKDHAGFLEAARRVAAQSSRVKFLMVGRGVDSGTPLLAEATGDPRLAGRLLLAGERGDVPRLLQALDVFCLSSWSEAFPNVVLEAAAAAVPCVVTRVGSAPDIAGGGAIVVEPRDPEALATALLRLVRATPEEREAMGLAANRYSAAHHSLESVVASHAAVFERAIALKEVH